MNRSFMIAGVCVLVLCLALLAWFWSRSGENDDTAYAVNQGGFSGVVVNGIDDLPISGALIEVKVLEDKRVYASESSNDRGQFSLAIEDGNYLIEASASDFMRRGKNDMGRQIAVMSATRFVNAKVKLWPPARLTGRIIDGQRGLRASVELAYEYDASGAEDYVYRRIDSAEDGRFVIDNAYAGLGVISVSAPGFASVTLGNIDLKFGANLDLGDIPLREGVSVYGLVSDAMTGRPVSGATISLRIATEPKAHETRSLHSGQYRLAAVSADRVDVTVKAEGYRDFNQSLSLQSSLNYSFDIALSRAWGLSLDVKNETGRLPLRTQITITDTTSDAIVYEQWVDNGPLLLDSLRGGPFEVLAQSYDKRTKVALTAELGQKVSVVLKAGAQLKVQVYSSDGEIIENPNYSYYYRAKSSDEATMSPWFSFDLPGFELKDLDAGFYQIQLRYDNGDIKAEELNLMPGDIRQQTIRLGQDAPAPIAPPPPAFDPYLHNDGSRYDFHTEPDIEPEPDPEPEPEPEPEPVLEPVQEQVYGVLEQGVEPEAIYEYMPKEVNSLGRPRVYPPMSDPGDSEPDASMHRDDASSIRRGPRSRGR